MRIFRNTRAKVTAEGTHSIPNTGSSRVFPALSATRQSKAENQEQAEREKKALDEAQTQALIKARIKALVQAKAIFTLFVDRGDNKDFRLPWRHLYFESFEKWILLHNGEPTWDAKIYKYGFSAAKKERAHTESQTTLKLDTKENLTRFLNNQHEKISFSLQSKQAEEQKHGITTPKQEQNYGITTPTLFISKEFSAIVATKGHEPNPEARTNCKIEITELDQGWLISFPVGQFLETTMNYGNFEPISEQASRSDTDLTSPNCAADIGRETSPTDALKM